MSSVTHPRLHALDAVRGGALLLGVFLHAAMSFFPTDGVWFIMDASRDPALSAGFFVIHMFRMTLFFVLAGFFGRMMFHRLGWAGFVTSRLKRVGLPLIVFWPIMMAAFTALIVWTLFAQFGGIPDDAPPPPAWTWETFPLTHLWFLYVLLIFYAAAIAARGLVALVDRNGAIRAATDRAVRAAFGSPLAVTLLAAGTATALLAHETWIPWFGVPTPDTGVVPNTPALVVFGSAFTLGWLLQRQIDVLLTLKKRWYAFLAPAIGCTIACLITVGLTPDFTAPLAGEEKITFAIAYAVGIWCWTFGLIGAALAFCSGESRAVRYLADSSYWIYLIHLPIVWALQIQVSSWGWPALAKYGFILGVSVPVMLLSYHLLVRGSFIGATLNGRAKKRARPAPVLTTEVAAQ